MLGVGLFVWALADVLQRYGFPAVWAWGGTVACACSLVLTTSEPLAFGLGMAGLALVDRHRLLAGTALLALAGLGRETALTFAVAAGVLLLLRQRRVPAVGVIAVAALPTAAWWAYVQSITERSRVPLGCLASCTYPTSGPLTSRRRSSCSGASVVSVLAWRDVPPLRWLAFAFAAWIPLYERYSFTMTSLPRLALPSVALGASGLLRWRAEQRPQATTARQAILAAKVAD